MLTVFFNALRKYRGQILGWGLGLALISALVVPLYTTVEEQAAQIRSLMETMPPALLTAFDIDAVSFATPRGYLNSKLFSFLPLVFGIFAAVAGAGILAQDEERGTLDLLMAHPVSRTVMFWGRTLAALLALFAIVGIGGLGAALSGQASGFPATVIELLKPYLSLGLVLAPVMAFALLLSMILPSRRLASAISITLLVASYFLSAFAKVDDRLLAAARLLPLHYYQSGHAMDGLNVTWAIGLLVATLVMALLAWRLFERRDLRVMGEGSWRQQRRLRPASR